MHGFGSYHPVVNMVYFVAVIGFSMLFMHPAALILSFLCAFSYSVLQGGKKKILINLLYMIPMTIIATAVNTLFNHEGVTIIDYLPSGNPLTLESIVYGVAASIMLINVICWFSCYNKVMTSDKFIYLFGRIIPSLSLMLSMTLRFVSRFKTQFKSVVNTQKCIGRNMSGGIIRRAKSGLSILSVMITWSLESSLDTADSMKSRGYGLEGRTAFSIFKFSKRDVITLFLILVLSTYVLVGTILGAVDFKYFPKFKYMGGDVFGISVFISYFILLALPIIIETGEKIKWKLLR